MSIPSIESLPVELLHQIFDNLDIETIIISLRSVSKLFRSVVHIYDRYILDFHLISKSNFYILCRLINPQNVISLKLSNDERTSNQINEFISLVHLRQFTRLRSLTLLYIDECHLNLILERINLNQLTSLSFKIKKYDDKTSTNHFSTILKQSNLCKLECGIKHKRLSEISWPINCTIQYLIITEGMTLDNLFTILQCSPNLHALIIKQKFSEIMNNMSLSFSFSIYFRQLTTLTIEILDVTFEELELFLVLIPSLIYLKLISLAIQIDGKRWERFVEVNLPYLTKFSFYFVQRNQTEESSELVFASFRTPFWIEHKKWFVICEYCALSKNIRLYSLPICASFMFYEPKSKVISSSTYPLMINYVKSISLRLSEEIINEIQQKRITDNDPLFGKATKIIIDIFGIWPSFSLKYLSVFIDISKIVQIELNSDKFEKYNQITWIDIGTFLLKAKNLCSLTFWNISFISELNQSIDFICATIPYHIKHLQIPINNLIEIEKIFNRCENLSTIKFDTKSSEFSKEVVKWFKYNTINSTCLEEDKTVFVWIGKKKIKLNILKINNKRIKLTTQ